MSKANGTGMLRRLVAPVDTAFVAVRVAIAEASGPRVLHASVDFTASTTAMTYALLTCMGLFRAAFDNTKSFDDKPAVLKTKATTTGMGVAMLGLALFLPAMANTQLSRIHLIGAIVDATLPSVLMERALARAVHREVVAVVKATLFRLPMVGLARRGRVAVTTRGAWRRAGASRLDAHWIVMERRLTWQCNDRESVCRVACNF